MSCRHVYEGNIEIFRFCDVGLVACKVPHSSAQISIDPGSVCGGVVCGGGVWRWCVWRCGVWRCGVMHAILKANGLRAHVQCLL